MFLRLLLCLASLSVCFLFQHGYTFVAEGRSLNAAVPAGKFRLRMIGDIDQSMMPFKGGSINTNFTTKEIRDYYVPNRNNAVFR